MKKQGKLTWLAPLAALGILAGNGAMAAGDAAAGQTKAAACLKCHKADAFAGLDEATIVGAIDTVASGKKPHPPVGSPSAQDVADIAAFFAAQKKAAM
jgi:cytochrome c553